MKKINLTSIIGEEDGVYVALCPELDVVSEGDSIDEAGRNLVEALELFFADVSSEEIRHRVNDARKMFSRCMPDAFVERLDAASKRTISFFRSAPQDKIKVRLGEVPKPFCGSAQGAVQQWERKLLCSFLDSVTPEEREGWLSGGLYITPIEVTHA